MKDSINNSHYILIVIPNNSDTNNIALALALSNYLYENNKKHKVFHQMDKLPKKFDFLPRYDKITNIMPKYYDLKIYIDEELYIFFKQNDLKISKNTAECLYAGLYKNGIKYSIGDELVGCGIDPDRIVKQLTRRDSLAKYRVLPRILDSLELHLEGRVATIYVEKEWLENSGARYWECEEAIDMVLNIGIVDVAILYSVIDGKIRVSIKGKK